jgi:hypothetical protein
VNKLKIKKTKAQQVQRRRVFREGAAVEKEGDPKVD